MAELTRYKKAGILLADVPRIDFAGQRSAAEVSGQLAKSLDRMSQWAFGEAFDQAKEEGLQYGAENPVTQKQLLDAVTAGEDPNKLFQKKNTIFGDAARASQVMALTSEIEMTAQQKMNMLKLSVERGEVDLPKAQAEIQAMLDGYGKSLVNVDPRASLKLRATLATNANSAYLAMSQSYFKQQDNLRKQGVDQWIDVTLGEQVRTIIEAGDTVDPTAKGAANVENNLTAAEKSIVQYHRNTIANKQVGRDAEGRPVTVYSNTIQIQSGKDKGKFVTVPGYFDGKMHDDEDQLWNKWKGEIAAGKWPVYDDAKTADERAKYIHQIMDAEGDGSNAGVITVQQRIDATLRRTLLNQLNTIPDPVFARQAMVRYDKIVSEARVDGVVKVARDPAFARNPVTGEWDGVGAVKRADAGDFGAYSSLYKSMPAEEQGKVLTALRQASADRYTAGQRAQNEHKQKETLEVNDLVVQFTTAAGPERQRILARLREISQTTGAISGASINTLVKAGQGDGEGNASAMLHAEMLVRRSGVTDIDQIIRQVPGLKAKQIAKLSDMIMDDGDKKVAKEVNTLAGIPEGIVQMTGDQQRRKLALTRAVEAIKRKQINATTKDDKPGTWDPDLVIAELNQEREKIMNDRAIQSAKDTLARFGQQRKGANITPETGRDELVRLGYKEAEIVQIQKQQRIIRGEE